MSTPLKSAVLKYLRAGNHANGTHKTYRTTLRKWSEWGGDVPIEELTRQEIRDFLDWVHEQAIEKEQSNPARTANKCRENLRAIMSWAWERDLVDVLPRFPKPRPHRRIAGRHYLTKPEINAIYFATHKRQRPRGWNDSIPIGRYWRTSIEILGHSVGGVTYRHYAHRDPLAFRAIMTIPQPSAFSAMVNGFDGQCPCCRRQFADG